MNNSFESRQTSIINELQNERLFKLWVAGYAPSELVTLYQKSSQTFSKSSLFRAMKKFKWKERKETLLKNLEDTNSEDIKYLNQEKINLIKKITLSCFNHLEEELREFLADGKNKPSWFPKTVKDLEILINLGLLPSRSGSKNQFLANSDDDDIDNLTEDECTELLRGLCEKRKQQHLT